MCISGKTNACFGSSFSPVPAQMSKKAPARPTRKHPDGCHWAQDVLSLPEVARARFSSVTDSTSLASVHGQQMPSIWKVVAPLVGSKHVLVVEDDDDIRDVIAQALRDDGYVVITARNGSEALDYLLHEPRQVDVVLLDWMMPIMDGRTFLRECRDLSWWSSVPVVVLSAAYRVQRSAAELGPNVRATLVKPFDLMVVLALVESLTTRPRG